MAHELEQPQKLHPLTLLYRIAVSLPGFLVLLYPTLEGGQERMWMNVLLLVVYGVFAIPWAVLYYLRFRFYITPDHVTIQKGIISRRNRSIPIDRIQNVEIQQTLFHRLLGIASVRLETAGTGNTEGKLEYISIGRARKIRKVIRSYRRVPAAQEAEEAVPPPLPTDAPETAAGELLYEMSFLDVLRRGAFQFSLIYIALIFSALEYLNIDLEQLLTEERFSFLWSLINGSPYLIGLASLFVAIFIGWLTGIATTLNRFYNFQLSFENGKLHKRRGLLTVAEGTIPLEKIQAYVLRSNILMRCFGWYSLEVQAMGLDSELEGRQIAAPLITHQNAEKLLSRISPMHLPTSYEKVSKLTIRRSFIRYATALTVIVLLAVWFGYTTAWWGFLALPALFYLAVLQYRKHGFWFDPQTNLFVVRRGVFQQRIWIVPIKNVQVLYTTTSIFQRRLSLGSLHVDTAGGPSSNYPQIIDLPAAQTDHWLEMLNNRFHLAVSE